MFTSPVKDLLNRANLIPVIFTPRGSSLPHLQTFLNQRRISTRLIRFYEWLAATVPVDFLERIEELGFAEKIYLDKTVKPPEVFDFSVADAQLLPVGLFAGMLRAPQTAFNPKWVATSESIKAIGGDRAHAQGFTGRGVKIAVTDSDSGIRFDQHVQLRGKTSSTTVVKTAGATSGHGTMVSTIAAGRRIHDTRSRVPVIGVAPDAEVLGIKALATPLGFGSVSAILDGIGLAIQNESDIVNLSLGGKPEANPEEDALVIGVNKAADRILVICAAGNEGPRPATLSSPAVSRKIISTASVNARTRQVSNFSSRGPPPPTVAAPGELIYSGIAIETLLDLMGEDNFGDGYAAWSGTSFSCPEVAGLIACAVEAWRRKGVRLTNELVFKLLRERSGNVQSNDVGYGVIQWEWIKP